MLKHILRCAVNWHKLRRGVGLEAADEAHCHFLICGSAVHLKRCSLPGATEAWLKVFFQYAMRPSLTDGNYFRRSLLLHRRNQFGCVLDHPPYMSVLMNWR